MKKFAFYLPGLCLLAFANAALADATSISFNTGNESLYADSMMMTLLSAGDVNTSGDGDVIRLGYYDNTATTNPFDGTFIALSGPGSTDSFTTTSIGDTPADANGDGTYALVLTFTLNDPTTGNNLPAAGTPMAIQFYNGTSLATSTKYNAVADALWTWVAPATPNSTAAYSLDDDAQSPLEWLDGNASAYYTSIAIAPAPEPSTYGWLAMGALGGLLRWKRSRKSEQKAV